MGDSQTAWPATVSPATEEEPIAAPWEAFRSSQDWAGRSAMPLPGDPGPEGRGRLLCTLSHLEPWGSSVKREPELPTHRVVL